MDELPDNVLKKILMNFNSSELKLLKLVSNRWERIIDEEIGITVYVGAGNTVYWRPGVDWRPINIIEEMGISKCYFSEVEDPIPEIGFKYPNLVRELSFDGYIERASFTRLLIQVASSLRKIIIHTSTLCFLKSQHLKYWELPLLTELDIYSYGCSPDMSWSYLDDCIMDNFTVILHNNQFPVLTSLRLSLMFVPRRECEMTMALVKFIVRHAETLRRLCLDFRYEGATNDELAPCSRDEMLMRIAIKLHRIKLQYFKLHFWYNGSPELHDVWHELLRQQNTLGTLIHVTGRGWSPFPSSIIYKNQSTLVRITLRLNLALDFFDCRPFQYCQNLRRLCLMNNDQRKPKPVKGQDNEHHEENVDISNSAELFINAPILSNAIALPKLLDTLFISWIKIHKNDIHFIHEELPLLQELSLTFVGTEGVFGIDRNTLAHLFKRRKLKRFTFLHGINQASCVLNDEQKKDPLQCMVTLLLQDRLLYLDVCQNKNGFYELCG